MKELTLEHQTRKRPSPRTPSVPGDVPHSASLRPLPDTLPAHRGGLTLEDCPGSIDCALTPTAT
jgi:hypothetical protein